MFSNLYFLSGIKKLNAVVFGLLASVFLNRALGPTLRGEYEFVYNIIVTASVVLHLGISTAFPNYYRKRTEWVNATFVWVFLMQAAIYSSVGLVWVLASSDGTVLTWVMAAVSNVLSTQMLSLCLVLNYRASVLANTLGVLLNAAMLGLMLLNSTPSVELALWCFVCKEVLIILVCMWYLREHVSLHKVNRSALAGILMAGIVPMLTNLLVVLNYRLDVVLLGVLHVNAAEIGLFAVGVALAEYAWLFADVFKEVVINKTAQGDNVASVARACRIASSAFAVAYPILWLFAERILVILYGEAYSSAGSVTRIVFFGVWSMVFVKLLGALWLARGEWTAYLLTLLASVAVNVAALFLLVPRFGLNGAALASVLSYSLAGGYFVVVFARRFRVPLRSLLILNGDDVCRFAELTARVKGRLVRK